MCIQEQIIPDLTIPLGMYMHAYVKKFCYVDFWIILITETWSTIHNLVCSTLPENLLDIYNGKYKMTFPQKVKPCSPMDKLSVLKLQDFVMT